MEILLHVHFNGTDGTKEQRALRIFFTIFQRFFLSQKGVISPHRFLFLCKKTSKSFHPFKSILCIFSYCSHIPASLAMRKKFARVYMCDAVPCGVAKKISQKILMRLTYGHILKNVIFVYHLHFSCMVLKLKI